MIRTKRVYAPAAPEDGFRVLVDRLWPRALPKERAEVDLWLKDVAPTTELRHWFGHDPAKWEEFKQRYFRELQHRGEALRILRAKARSGTVTLLFSSREAAFNNAVALQEFLQSRARARTPEAVAAKGNSRKPNDSRAA